MKLLVRMFLVFISVGFALTAAQVSFTLWHSNPVPRRDESMKCRILNPVLGGGFKRNCRCRWKRTQGDQVIFDVAFSTDNFGRRITPGGVSEWRQNVVLFFGGSFTLGAGVNDNETTPYYFSRKAATYNVYNYAGSGFGPQQMLAALSEMNLPRQVKPVTGRKVAIYQFLHFHIQRAVGKPSVANTYGKYFPYYALNDAGQLVRKGNFSTGRPVLTRLHLVLSRLSLLRFLLEAYTDTPSEKDIQLTARIIEESRRKFTEIFNSEDFFVVFFPGSDSQINSQMISILQKRRIQCFDYSGLVDMRAPGATLGDGHPTAKIHRRVGEELAEALAP